MKLEFPRNTFAKNIIAAILLIAASAFIGIISSLQSGPALDHARLRVDGYGLGMEGSAKDYHSGNVDFFEGRYTSVAGYTLGDGNHELRTGFITRANLVKRLGTPVGFTETMGNAGGSPIWIYELALGEEVHTKRGKTSKGFLHVHFDEFGDLLHLSLFEIVAEGSFAERWPRLGWTVNSSGEARPSTTGAARTQAYECERLSIDGVRLGMSREEVTELRGAPSTASPDFCIFGSLEINFRENQVSLVKGDRLEYDGVELARKESPEEEWVGVLDPPVSVERNPGCGYSSAYNSTNHYPELGLTVSAIGEKGWWKDGPATAYLFTLSRARSRF